MRKFTKFKEPQRTLSKIAKVNFKSNETKYKNKKPKKIINVKKNVSQQLLRGLSTHVTRFNS